MSRVEKTEDFGACFVFFVFRPQPPRATIFLTALEVSASYKLKQVKHVKRPISVLVVDSWVNFV